MEPQNNLAWVTGANGLIGNYFVSTAPQFAPQWQVRGLTRAQFDLLDFQATEREFKKDRPRCIIHCAAIPTVVGALADPGLARRINVEATRFLVELAAETKFIFLSTDFVFDGRKGNYLETDPVNPISFYGETKVAAEEIVLTHPSAIVVRTSINCGTSKSGLRGFNEALRHDLRTRGSIKMFTDEFRSPMFAGETARAGWELAAKDCAGIFHAAGAERLSRWQMGQLLALRSPELKSKMEPGLIRDSSGPPRAPDTSLDISKIQKILSRPLPGLTEWLAANPDEPF
ncbi:MAG TPA: SDR family oxidoreductase [Verrucomicrobiae bacterium]|jgi:dTDP-4-dehydrorhamnose reductase